MAEAERIYPFEMKDKEIKKEMKEHGKHLKNASVNTVTRYGPYVQLGQSELQTRKTKRIAILSVLIAVTALVISLLNIRSNRDWEKRQLETLERTNTILSDVRENTVRK